jgi:hypothetical protein
MSDDYYHIRAITIPVPVKVFEYSNIGLVRSFEPPKEDIVDAAHRMYKRYGDEKKRIAEYVRVCSETFDEQSDGNTPEDFRKYLRNLAKRIEEE